MNKPIQSPSPAPSQASEQRKAVIHCGGRRCGEFNCESCNTPIESVSAEGEKEQRASYLRHVGSWKCAHCDFVVAHDSDWSKMSKAISEHYDSVHIPQPSPVAGQTERTFWVIERFEDGRSKGYWFGNSSREFSDDINQAIQFCRREDASRVRLQWHWKDVEVTEHKMLSASSLSPQDMRKGFELPIHEKQTIWDSDLDDNFVGYWEEDYNELWDKLLSALQQNAVLKERAERAEKIVATYNKSGFADADRMAEKYLEAIGRAEKAERGPCCREPWCGGDCTCKICAPDLAIADLESQVKALTEEVGKLKRKLAVIFDESVYSDSLGVEGSSFSVCRWCGGGSGPGGNPGFKHNTGCLMDDDALEKKVADIWEELPSLRSELSAAESQLSAIQKEMPEAVVVSAWEYLASSADQFVDKESGIKEEFRPLLYGGYCSALSHVAYALNLPVDDDGVDEDSATLKRIRKASAAWNTRGKKEGV